MRLLIFALNVDKKIKIIRKNERGAFKSLYLLRNLFPNLKKIYRFPCCLSAWKC